MRLLHTALVIAALASFAPVAPAATTLDPGVRHVRASDGTDLYVKVEGAGPACLLVHGGPGQGSLSTEAMGADQLESFLTMIYLDQRGSGHSADAADYSLERMLRDFDEVRQALELDRMCLVAHSFGALLAEEYARRYPEHVSKLVIANGTLQFQGPYNARMQVEFVNHVLGREVVAIADDASDAALADAQRKARAALMASGEGYRFLSESPASIQAMSKIDGSYERTIDFGMAVIEHPDTYPAYYADHAPHSRDVPHPVLVITSRDDYAVGPDEYRRFRFPHQQTVVLDGGHMSYYEQTDAFVDAIRAFMDGGAASPPPPGDGMLGG